MAALCTGPAWILERKIVIDLSENSLRHLKTKYKKAKYVVKEKLAESNAPEHSNELS